MPLSISLWFYGSCTEARFWPLFPTLGIVDKRCVVASIEFVASLIGEVLSGSEVCDG